MRKLDSAVKVYFKLTKDIKIFHSYCDPGDMTEEDAERWVFYNKLFYPENYTEEELKDATRYGSNS